MSSDTWTREKAEAGVQLIELADKRHVHKHRILVTQQVDIESGSSGRDPLRPSGGRIRLNAVYVAGPYRGQFDEVTIFGGELVGGFWEQPWIRLTIGDVNVPERLRRLGLGTYLFNEVVAWAKSLGLKHAKVLPIKLKPGGSEMNHAGASRFYGQFGIRFLPAEDGKPPESYPELLVTDLIAPLPEKSSAIARAISEGLTEAIDEAIARHEEHLMKRHGKEFSQLCSICDRWKWVAISGWLALTLLVIAWLR